MYRFTYGANTRLKSTWALSAIQFSHCPIFYSVFIVCVADTTYLPYLRVKGFVFFGFFLRASYSFRFLFRSGLGVMGTLLKKSSLHSYHLEAQQPPLKVHL